MYVKCHSFLLCVGIKGFVSCAKWSAFALSFSFTVGHITEHMISVNPSNMVFYSYFKEQKTEIVEFEALVDSIMVMSCLLSNLVELVLFVIIIHELVQLHLHRVRINMANTQGSIITERYFQQTACGQLATGQSHARWLLIIYIYQI